MIRWARPSLEDRSPHFRKGYKSGRAGKSHTENPYARGSVQGREWGAGWRLGRGGKK